MAWFPEGWWERAKYRLKESVTWLSVQVTAAWGVVWIMFSSLPAQTMTEISQIHILNLSVIAWAGLMQTVTTYLARVKPPKPPTTGG